MRRTLVLLALASAALVGCSDDDGDDVNADAVRYCELVREIEEQGVAIFEDIPEDATAEDYAEAEARLIEEMDDELDELVDVAHPEIEDDVTEYVAAYRARAAGEEAEDVSAQEERILEWEEERCE